MNANKRAQKPLPEVKRLKSQESNFSEDRNNDGESFRMQRGGLL